jgi:hypothetical protein
MRFDNVMIRLSAVMGAEWIQAYALIKCHPDVDVEKFRFEVPQKLKRHHETEKYVGGTPGDLFIGFFARGQAELFDELSVIKAWKETLRVTEFAIGNFPVHKANMTKLDWQIVKSLRSDANKKPRTIAKEVGAKKRDVEQRLTFIKEIPLGFSIAPANDRLWKFTEIHIELVNCTFKEKMAELMKIGKPFGAAGARNQGAVMIKPTSHDELQNAILAVNAIPGVEVTACAFSEDMIWTQPWLDKFIEEQIATYSS